MLLCIRELCILRRTYDCGCGTTDRCILLITTLLLANDLRGLKELQAVSNRGAGDLKGRQKYVMMQWSKKRKVQSPLDLFIAEQLQKETM